MSYVGGPGFELYVPVELTRHVFLALQEAGKKLGTGTPTAYAWGGESIIINGETVGEISSVGWSPKAGACVALGYVRGAAANQPHEGTSAAIELWGERIAVRLYDRWVG